jgi:hypothetical protein
MPRPASIILYSVFIRRFSSRNRSDEVPPARKGLWSCGGGGAVSRLPPKEERAKKQKAKKAKGKKSRGQKQKKSRKIIPCSEHSNNNENIS